MRVFLTGSGVGDLAEVWAVLRELAADVSRTDETPVGTRWPQVLRSEIARADLAVLVIGGTASTISSWAIFEVGLVVGAGIPLLILTDPGVELPAPLQSFQVAELPGGVRNTEALRFHLGLFLARHGAKVESRAIEKPALERPIDVRHFRDQLRKVRGFGDAATRGRALEEWTAEVFRASGAETYTATPSRGLDRGFDLVVNVPGLPRSGPLVIEVLSGEVPSKRLHSDVLRLQYAVLQEKPVSDCFYSTRFADRALRCPSSRWSWCWGWTSSSTASRRRARCWLPWRRPGEKRLQP